MSRYLYKQHPILDEGYLRVSKIHRIYYNQSGNLQGLPIVHLHGGPGSKSKPKYRRFYDQKKFRIIIFDQRGCGKSRPAGELNENTTSDLIEDIEKLRKHLGIRKWIVHAGSWGSTLALAYAEGYPKAVQALLLRGVFLFRKRDIDWIMEGKELRRIFPDLWRERVKSLKNLGIDPENSNERLYEIFISGSDQEKRIAATCLENWEGQMYKVRQKIKLVKPEDIDEKMIEGGKIFMHYVVNNGFFNENQLIRNTKSIRNIPMTIIHGRYDVVCPIDQAWELHKALPNSVLEVVTAAGHHSDDVGNARKIRYYLDKIAEEYSS